MPSFALYLPEVLVFVFQMDFGKPVLGEMCMFPGLVCVCEWFCLLFGCIFLQRCGT